MEIKESSKELLKSGGYAKKQIFADCSILKWSHQQRFLKALIFLKKSGAKTLLDYGCGDATFLVLAREMVDKKIGLEIDETQLGLLKDRFKNESDFEFKQINEPCATKADLVTCFEVLEHCTPEAIEDNLVRLKNFCSETGTVIISVPKETGLTVIGKQSVRKLLALRKFGTYEYTQWYSWVDFFKMVFATENTEVPRKYYDVQFGDKTYTTCGHYAFNWKRLKLDIQRHFTIQEIDFSPKLIVSWASAPS
ncbi:MAG: hypothetical protein Fur0010_26300 [Bdellovibrio sp.]